ncbi:MAG: hypothetical protein M3Z26_00475 [Bacteroidota bacterium]|nr:hypothetical protein [Bacteroidota bacterium]
MPRSAQEILKLTQERRFEREDEKSGKKKSKRVGNMNWVEGMSSPNPTGRPKGVKNKFSKRMRDQMRRLFESNIYRLEIEAEKFTPIQRLKILELIGKFVLEEKKTIKKEVKHIHSVVIDVTGESENPEIIEDAKYYLEEEGEENN